MILIAVFFNGALLFTGESPPSEIRAPLRFREDGTFQISIFEDLHFGESIMAPSCEFDQTEELTLSRCMGAMGPTAGHRFHPSHEQRP